MGLFYSDAFRHVPDYIGERQDMGIDASGNGPVYPYGKCRIVYVINDWYQGKPLVAYELLRGPMKGKLIYLAECVIWNPRALRAGQVFYRKQALGRMSTSCGTGIEYGWAAPWGGPLNHTEYVEGRRMAGAASFNRWLKWHGWKRSRNYNASEPIYGTLPVSYP